jgi:hypothetical protein
MPAETLLAYALGFGILGPAAVVVLVVGLRGTAARWRSKLAGGGR